MIKEFKNDYGWLSNFALCEIRFNGMLFASVEHAYMSAKSHDEEWKKFCLDSNNSAGKVKRKSKKIVLREDWNEMKVLVMKELLEQKFSQSPFKNLLLDTGNIPIEEGNYWGDVFWGVDIRSNEGENQLGKLIMDIRDNLSRNIPKKKPYRRLVNSTLRFVRRWL